jgi:hypothetical protein
MTAINAPEVWELLTEVKMTNNP